MPRKGRKNKKTSEDTAASGSRQGDSSSEQQRQDDRAGGRGGQGHGQPQQGSQRPAQPQQSQSSRQEQTPPAQSTPQRQQSQGLPAWAGGPQQTTQQSFQADRGQGRGGRGSDRGGGQGRGGQGRGQPQQSQPALARQEQAPPSAWSTPKTQQSQGLPAWAGGSQQTTQQSFQADRGQGRGGRGGGQPQQGSQRPAQQQQSQSSSPRQEQAPSSAWSTPKTQQSQGLPAWAGGSQRPAQQQQSQSSSPRQEQAPPSAWSTPKTQQSQGLPAWAGGSQQTTQQSFQADRGQGRGGGRGGGQPSHGGRQQGGKDRGPRSQQPSGSAAQDISKGVSKLSISETAMPVSVKEEFSHKGAIDSKKAAALIKQIPERKDLTRDKAKGHRINVYTNMLPLTLKPNFCTAVNHYDVSFDDKTPKNVYRDIMRNICNTHFPFTHPAYDGKKNLYTVKKLFSESEFQEEVAYKNLDGREKTTIVKIKLAQVIDLSWLKSVKVGYKDHDPSDQTAIQALDVVLRAPLFKDARLLNVGRSIFWQQEGAFLGDGANVWVGAFQSAIVGWKPYLNVDVAHKAFLNRQMVSDYLMNMYAVKEQKFRYMDYEEYDQVLLKVLKTHKVRYQIPGKPDSKRVWSIIGFGKIPDKHEFLCKFPGAEVESKITINAYFKMKGYHIKMLDLPCIQVAPKEKNIFLPPELCEIMEGQAKNFKLSEEQTRQMVRFAATSTDERKKKILQGMNVMNHNRDLTINEFGISVGDNFEKVPARVLDPPQLAYNQQNVTVSKGVWNSGSFKQPSAIAPKSWSIVIMNPRINDRDCNNLERFIIQTGQNLGMQIGEASRPYANVRNERELESKLNNMKANKMQLVFVVISDRAGSYEKVKQIAEQKVGILTQCLKSLTVTKKLNQSTMQNILLKVNAKLNGTNHSLTDQCRPRCLQGDKIMIIGADVTHPDPGSKMDKPSIAAVAASHDKRDFFQYNIEVRLQSSRTEIIVDLKNIVHNQMKIYQLKTNCLPDTIFFFRDGVSEGQLPQVMEHEIKAVREACKKFNSSYAPALVFMVVQKRHHTRFFPEGRNPDDRRNNNVSAGTIVDTFITHPSHIDFYLVSHASIQGTARPTKYRCLCNDANISEDDIEEMTYYLCHLFSRCNRSVSYPAPTYYAHLAAFRARAWTFDRNIDMTKLAQEQKYLEERVSGKNPMFFV